MALTVSGSLRQPQRVGDMAAALADFAGDLVLGIGKAVHQFVIGGRFFDGVEILTLDVLDDGEFERLAVAHLAHHHRHIVQLGQLGRPPAPLARDDLECVDVAGDGTHQDRLQDALFLHRLGEIVQILFARSACAAGSGWAAETRSARVRMRAAARFAACRHRLFADQGRKAAAQSARTHSLQSFRASALMPPVRIRSRWINSPASLI